MPISPIVLQRRHAELGRIRLGQKGDRGQPQKLSRFRFTSPSKGYIDDLAALYGGTPQPWDNSGKPEFEVFTEATSIPVIAVKGGLSQWLEYWQGGGIVHRCDGEVNVLTGEACDHEEKVKTRVRGQDVWVNPHAEAKPTTRLSVMLPELDAIGVWRMESHGWNAAAEIPAVAELATHVGDLVPAVLHLVERRTVKDGKTSRFVVPVLDLRIGVTRLREIAAEKAGLAEIAAPASATAPAIEAGPSTVNPYADYLSDLEDAGSLEMLAALWDSAAAEGLVGKRSEPSQQRADFVNAWKAKAAELKAAEQKPADPQPDAEGIYEGETVDDPPPAAAEGDEEAVWQLVVAEAGKQGMTLADLQDDFPARMGGITSDSASAAEMRKYIELLQTETGDAA